MGFSPSKTPRSRGLRTRTINPATGARKATIRKAPWTPDLKLELFPLRSPLLGESLLVSFPPLINMLKFSG